MRDSRTDCNGEDARHNSQLFIPNPPELRGLAASLQGKTNTIKQHV
jgi:hypothetical protein